MENHMGKQIRAHRLRGNMTQEKLAETLHVTAQAVSKWENGTSCPDVSLLPELSATLGVTLDELLNVDTSRNRPAVPEDDPIDPSNPLPHGSYFEHVAEKKRRAFPYPVLVSFLYLALGCFLNLWHPGWLIFLTIPLWYLPASERSPLKLLGNPIMVTIIYLLLGIECNLWHPGWLIFFAIPILNAAVR